MKHLLFFAILFMSCQKQDPHVEAIMNEIKRTANDPSSIEYVETLGVDTLTINDARQNAIARETRVRDAVLGVIEASEGLMDIQGRYGSVDEKTKAEYEKSKSEALRKSAEIDSIKLMLTSPDSNAIKEIYYYSSIRGKNAMGALVLNRYKATFNNDGKLLDLSPSDD